MVAAENDDIDKLIAKLKHGSQKEQINAAKYLGEIKNKKAVVPLGERLSSGIDDLVAKHIINALVKIGDTRAIEYLREAQIQYPEKIKKHIVEAVTLLRPSDSDFPERNEPVDFRPSSDDNIPTPQTKKLKSQGASEDSKPSGLLTLSAIIASLLCFVAGIWMLTITSEATISGEPGSIFEPAIHAVGVYFIAKGFFIGPALYMMGKNRG